MKKYIAPEMEIAKFQAEDIITTSGAGTGEPAITKGGTTNLDGAFNYIVEDNAF